VRRNGGNGGYVHSENTIQFATHVKAKLILARSVRVGLRREGWRVREKVAIEFCSCSSISWSHAAISVIITKKLQRLTQVKGAPAG